MSIISRPETLKPTSTQTMTSTWSFWPALKRSAGGSFTRRVMALNGTLMSQTTSPHRQRRHCSQRLPEAAEVVRNDAEQQSLAQEYDKCDARNAVERPERLLRGERMVEDSPDQQKRARAEQQEV